MHYELWDVRSRNMLADFDTEAEALMAVRDFLAINSPDMADELTVVWRDEDRGAAVAEGSELARHAGAFVPDHAPSSL